MEKYSSYKDSGEKWLGEIPGHWDLIKTSYVFDKIGSGTTPASGNADYYSEDGEYFLQTGDLNDGVIKSTSKKITQKAIRDKSMKIYPKDSLVIAMYGATIGKMGILGINTTVNQACCVMSPSSKISIKYAFYMFTVAKTNLLLQSKGGGQPNISQETICNERIIVPPLPEQQAIVSYLDRVTGDIDRAIAESQRMIDLLNERKQIIIQHAVTKGLNPNAKRKYSGVEWIGDVPEGWECLPLKFVFEMRNGYTPSKNDPSLWTNGSIPWYRMEDIRKSGRFLNESIQKVTQKAVNGKGVFSAGSFIMAICTASIGEHAMLIVDSLANQRFANFKIRKSLSDKFLPMYLYYYFFVIGDFCRNNANSTCFQYVDMAALKNLPIAVPNMEEQRSIVSYLDENLQTLSQAIASAERKISLLRERKQIIINEVVTGKVKVS